MFASDVSDFNMMDLDFWLDVPTEDELKHTESLKLDQKYAIFNEKMLFFLLTMNYKQLIGIVLIWVSKFLLLTECATCSIRIEDPEWNTQWYLYRRNGYDMNVLPAWRSCVNGTGVTVGVVDKGVQDHEDLSINRSLDIGKRQSDEYWSAQWRLDWRRFGYNTGYRQYQKQESLKHGTRVAGIVAAKKNGRDITIASTAVFESFNADFLRHHYDVIDVYSCSFANFHTGTKTYPLLSSQKNALDSGTTYGRGGLGSVYVFATGNSGGDEADVFRDSCSYDRLVTNRYVISVAGIQHNLQKLPNGEACSAMMVAAFTSKAGDRFNRVVTTDIRNRITSDFNQNSAAAPMVSGAVALALSANPALTYRDIMHLLVQTSRSDLREERYKSNFFTNAANFKVSSYFGFGLLDIGKLVERSETWINVPRRQNCTTRTTLNRRLNRDSIVVQVIQCSVTYIEHVEISLKVNHQHAGQIKCFEKYILAKENTTSFVILFLKQKDLKNVQLGCRVAVLNSVQITWIVTEKICCNNGCGHTCEWSITDQITRNGVSSVVTERSHECPSRLQSRCVEQCSNNTDCNGRKICCHNGCGHTCEWSLTDIGYLGGWSTWSHCSQTCGDGSRTRNRLCDRHGSCIGNRQETQLCNLPACPSDIGYWRNWSAWSHCSQTCGDGSRTRTRVCDRHGRCIGNRQDTQLCNLPVCSSVCFDIYPSCSDYFRRTGCNSTSTHYMATTYCRRTCNICY
ncbi:FURIN [Mytilus coruscus]|uniref:FURIN n=1 Tax=Mytilus coruscus TaxID=42192 RepID=A0A6J8B9V2_MYTCO|nr:FURIN [Mytilus coruscus]